MKESCRNPDSTGYCQYQYLMSDSEIVINSVADSSRSNRDVKSFKTPKRRELVPRGCSDSWTLFTFSIASQLLGSNPNKEMKMMT